MNPSNQSQHNNGPDIPDFKLALSLSPPSILKPSTLLPTCH
ncbi:hypothetical protein Ptr902_02077 [Pyrenophora tritici-repentis]|uniref:Uncharacterized protein n=1 Tax=Pyrenophora tritici-repentis TaxID=45151 RepID=A0A834VVX4_9PLEO|nr:hypothetical protein PtrM4_008490 [Pyrenophora tritici-repentis]KAI1520414.1 hypothetical protein Ptr86124_000782 [Pyrenophora tritici-repentis]KAI1675216.1 hypothetical protein L13192_01963 [Pyrenophora tritici-repentis]KAI1687633.1 hypothetical protein KJE20_00810 [Pyrenophora tritici-repentis]KAI2487944.1 hypothetical protein Ptr902_02077 [Pyrenophora tritici-repentis]